MAVNNFEVLRYSSQKECTSGLLFDIIKDNYIGDSTSTYKIVYPRIANTLAKGEKCFVTYIDFDNLNL